MVNHIRDGQVAGNQQLMHAKCRNTRRYSQLHGDGLVQADGFQTLPHPGDDQSKPSGEKVMDGLHRQVFIQDVGTAIGPQIANFVASRLFVEMVNPYDADRFFPRQPCVQLLREVNHPRTDQPRSCSHSKDSGVPRKWMDVKIRLSEIFFFQEGSLARYPPGDTVANQFIQSFSGGHTADLVKACQFVFRRKPIMKAARGNALD